MRQETDAATGMGGRREPKRVRRPSHRLWAIAAAVVVSVLVLAGLPWNTVAQAGSSSSGTAGSTLQECPVCPELVRVPAGVLERRGAPAVTVESFWMARTETTFDQWQACVDDGACRGGQDDHGWGRGRRPVINVTYDDAEAYAAWLSSITGKRYRLPSEDEWEWAARGGTTTAWWWGDEVGTGHANCRKCGTEWSGRMTAPVASLPPNPFGLHDMAGNVWEWVSDCWHPERDAPPAVRDCRQRVTKGGAWYYIPSQARPTARARSSASLWSYTVGFRVVRERD